MSRRRPRLVRRCSDLFCHQVPPGYGERHVCTVWVGSGETRLSSPSSKDQPDKPMAKPDGGQRESDGVVVPMIGVRDAPGGKDPDFGHACGRR